MGYYYFSPEMPIDGFEDYNTRNCLLFYAEIYRYEKTEKEKKLHFKISE